MARTTTLYVSDLDGTLLDANSQLSPESIATLNHLITRQGALFTVATARTPATVVPLLQQVRTTLPFVVMAGAAMWDNASRTLLHVQKIDPEIERAIVAIYERHGLQPFIYRQHGHVLHAHHVGAMSASEEAFVAQRQGSPYKRFLLDAPAYEPSPDPAMLIFSMNDYGRLEQVYREVVATTPCEAMFYHDIFDPHEGLLEIYRKGTTKAAAIRRLAQEVGATRIVAFGDNRNDIAMLQAADVAVAVENAVPEVKAVAHSVIGPNTAHSVARYIERDLETQGE
ncbi:MAG: HAD family hydrolase [Muribaculaceae bacterium]|nr:HAD family hydrolase [Muribaculaceae bacterium]